MPEYSASLAPTLSTIDTYVGQMATVNQQLTFSIGITGCPSDTFTAYPATQGQLNSNQYSSPPNATLTYSAPYANYIWLIMLRGNNNGKMVYARLDMQAKLRFRQTCYSYNRGRSSTGAIYYYYSVIEAPSVRLHVTNINFQIYTITANDYSKPGYNFAPLNTTPGTSLKASSATYDNTSGGFIPFGTYTFKTAPLSSGSQYALFSPSGARVVYWDNLDASYPYDDTFTQVGFGLCANNTTYAPTLDNWTAKDI